jgi:hypothetical protein
VDLTIEIEIVHGRNIRLRLSTDVTHAIWLTAVAYLCLMAALQYEH